MLQGFKNFLMRGDVIVVAVGLVVALAFSALITSFTTNIGSPYLTGVPLARFPVPDGLGGPDRYGALATSRDRRRERR
jgi:Large-conductance mechanosensitive channel, MscL